MAARAGDEQRGTIEVACGHGAGLGPEPDPVLLVVGKHVDDLRQIERDGAVLGRQVVPPAGPERAAQPR